MREHYLRTSFLNFAIGRGGGKRERTTEAQRARREEIRSERMNELTGAVRSGVFGVGL